MDEKAKAGKAVADTIWRSMVDTMAHIYDLRQQNQELSDLHPIGHPARQEVLTQLERFRQCLDGQEKLFAATRFEVV